MKQLTFLHELVLPRHQNANITMVAETSVRWGSQHCFMFRFELHPTSEYGNRLSGVRILRSFERYGYRPAPRSVLDKVMKVSDQIPEGVRIFSIQTRLSNHVQEYAHRVAGQWQVSQAPVKAGDLRDTDLFLALLIN